MPPRSAETSVRRPSSAVPKVTDKLGVIRALRQVRPARYRRCHGFTFLAAQGYSVGESFMGTVTRWRPAISLTSIAAPNQIVLPPDLTVLGPSGRDVRQVGAAVPDGYKGLDIGPGSACRILRCHRLPPEPSSGMGRWASFEDPRFEAGTRTVAEAVAECRRVHHRRRRRLGCGGVKFGLGRRDRSRVHRRRGVVGVHRAGRLARLGRAVLRRRLRCSIGGAVTSSSGRVPFISGNWKMHLQPLRALIAWCVKLAYMLPADDISTGIEVSMHPPFTRSACRSRPMIDVDRSASCRRPALSLGGQGRVHRRGQPGLPGQAGRALLHRRALGAAGRSSTRPTRSCERTSGPSCANGMTPILVRRGDPR